MMERTFLLPINALILYDGHKGLTVAQVALAWLLAQKPFIVPIPGTTKLAHAQENLWAADFAFTPEELEKLTTEINTIKLWGHVTRV